MDHRQFTDKMLHLTELIRKHAAIHGVYQFGKNEFPETLRKNHLKVLHEHDWTQYTKPSFDRLRRLAKPTAPIVKALKLERYFVNAVAAAMYSDGVEAGIFAYKVYTAKK